MHKTGTRHVRRFRGIGGGAALSPNAPCSRRLQGGDRGEDGVVLSPLLSVHRRPRRGFTLLEVLLALTLTIILMAGVYSFYVIVLQAREDGSRSTRVVKLNRALLERMAEEIRHVTSLVPGDGIGFQGDRHRITLVRAEMPELYAFDRFDLTRDHLPPAQLDLRRITYELLWDDEREDDEGVKICHGMWRTEQRTFDPNPKYVVHEDEATLPTEEEPVIAGPQPEGELIAPEIKYLEFRYFDGAEWRDRWQVADEGEGGVPPDGAGAGAGAGLAGLGDLGDLAGAGSKAGGDPPAKTGLDGGYALPQAVKITIGQERVPPEDDELELEKLEEMANRRDAQEYHEDRYTIVVSILQADQTLLSSRKYGVADSMSRQEGGTSR